jgi:hypothetical protein
MFDRLHTLSKRDLMGLFDVLAKQAIGSLLGASSNPKGELLSGLLNQAGGTFWLDGEIRSSWTQGYFLFMGWNR